MIWEILTLSLNPNCQTDSFLQIWIHIHMRTHIVHTHTYINMKKRTVPQWFSCWLCWKQTISPLLEPHAEKGSFWSSPIIFYYSDTGGKELSAISTISCPLSTVANPCSFSLLWGTLNLSLGSHTTRVLEDMPTQCYKMPRADQLADTLNSL